MKYITIGAAEPVLYTYRKSDYRHSYITPKLQDYRERFFPRYERTSTLRAIAASYLVSSAESELQRDKPRRTYGGDWARFFHQPVVIYSNKHKARGIKKPQKPAYELVELKTEGCGYEFLIRDTTTKRFVEWEDLPDVDSVREHLRGCPFPKDKCFSREKFLDELENAEGHILLWVEKRATAEFICELCSELI